METAEDKYTRIIKQALASMNNIEAPFEAYQDALRRAIEEFQTELSDDQNN